VKGLYGLVHRVCLLVVRVEMERMGLFYACEQRVVLRKRFRQSLRPIQLMADSLQPFYVSNEVI
jgi:hypothetical protein